MLPLALYVDPPAVLPPYETLAPTFYHVITFPDGVTTAGDWDLRGHVDEYFGGFDFAGKRVLEIGPASGFLTISMEQRGASVTAVEVPEDAQWDTVPYHAQHLDAVADFHRRLHNHMPVLRAGFWYTHRAFRSKARLIHANASRLPSHIGKFDVAVLAAVLLHTRNPHDVIQNCAQMADTIIIVDLYIDGVEGDRGPVIMLVPNVRDHINPSVWWHLSTQFLWDFLQILGFKRFALTRHEQLEAKAKRRVPMFTLIAQR